MKIVIADDSSLLRDRISKLLKGMNEKFVIYEAENGQRAMELIYAKKPDEEIEIIVSNMLVKN